MILKREDLKARLKALESLSKGSKEALDTAQAIEYAKAFKLMLRACKLTLKCLPEDWIEEHDDPVEHAFILKPQDCFICALRRAIEKASGI